MTAAFAILMFLAAFVVTTAYQQWSGAFGAEMGSVFPDEAPHYINGLLIERFLLGGLGHDPMGFARSFYLHYPKVSIGHWPPAFYVVEALWMLLVSESIRAAIIFSGVITAALATLVGTITGRRQGWIAGLIAGLAFTTLPMIRGITASLMVDVFIGLLVLAGTLFYIRYLDNERWTWAALFGLASSAAILSKGNGLEMALLPPFAILFTGRFRLLRQPSFWLPVGIVAVLCGPWTALTYKATAAGFMYPWGLGYSALALSSNAGFIWQAIAPIGLLLAAVGFASAWRIASAEPREFNARCGFGASVAMVFAFQAIVPSGIEARYMIPALAGLIILAARGIEDLGAGVAARVRAPMAGQAVAGALAVLALVPDLLALPSVEAKPRLGMNEAIAAILNEHPGGRNPVVLIGSDGEGESAFVAGVAAADSTRRLIAARGFKLLSSGNFMGTDYAIRFGTAEEAGAEVERAGVAYVVLDTAPQSLRYGHNRQLAQDARLRNWPLLARLPRSHYPGETLLYRVDVNRDRNVDAAELARTLGTPSPFQ